MSISSATDQTSQQAGDTAGEIIEVDFGKDKNEFARRYCRLLGLVEEHETKVLRDPLKYLAMAAREITALRLKEVVLQDAARFCVKAEVCGSHVLQPAPLDTVRIAREEYDRWKAVERLLHAPAATPEHLDDSQTPMKP